MAKWLKITDENFQREVLGAGLPVVLLEFTAEWAGISDAWRRTLDDIADEYEGRVTFGIADIDDSPDLALQYGIRGVPVRLFFKNGEWVSYFTAIQRREDVVEWIEGCV